MPHVSLKITGKIARTPRVQQLEAMFDVPASTKLALSWEGNIPLEERPWNIGLIVGASGSGKSQLLNHLFGAPQEFLWDAGSVVDDFSDKVSIEEVARVCQAVGFNTIPAWLRPFGVLSNGEKFRVELARRLLECTGTIVVDEFTSVVDRQVAQIGAHAVQKYVRKAGRRFVAASCHHDIVDWLQPDWVLEPATMRFQWRELQPRPRLDCRMGRVPYAAWSLFSRYHYLTADLNPACRCFGLWVGEVLAAFSAVIQRPHPTAKDIYGISRVVTLPDWQGLGLASTLDETLGAAFKAMGKRLRAYPAHPSRIRTLDRSPKWHLVKKPGVYSPRAGATTTVHLGGRPCAVFEYAGDGMPRDEAERFLGMRL